MLASTQETLLIKTVSSFKLQQASEGKSFYFILACPCIYNKDAKDQTKPIYSLSLPPQTGDGESQTHDADFIKST
jgi:hypothetical protein